MHRRSYAGYDELIALALRLAFRASIWALYGACIIAVQLTVLFITPFAAGTGTRRVGNPPAEAAFVGLLSGAAWVFGIGTVIGVAAGSAAAWLVGMLVAAPLGCVVGWQAGIWQEAGSWSRMRGGLVLGSWRSGRFFVSRPYTVTPSERTKHLVCSGATGTGKSTLVRNLILQDLATDAGVCVIDPKDDLIDRLLPHIPDARIEDVILFDAADRERPLGLNPFADVPASQRSLAASELIAVFRRYFVDAWGARLEHVLRNVILALLEAPGATLTDVPRLLLDRSYVHWVVEHVTNPAVREFFEVEYEQVLKRRSDAIEPILNKVGPWLAYPELRSIIGQPKSAFDLRTAMDEGKVLLVRIPQGVFGEDVSNLLGALIVAKVQLAAQSRVDTPGHARRPFYLYVDEFQNFATSSFSKIVTEARAFNVGLVCINQYPEQLSRDLQLALARNAATFVQTAYRRGRYSLEVTRQEDVREKEPPVYSVTPPPPLPAGNADRARRIREMSRSRYGSQPLESVPMRPVPNSQTSGRPAASAWGHDVEEE